MSTAEHVEIDLGLVEELTKRETAALDEKHALAQLPRGSEDASSRRRVVVVADVAAAPDLRRPRQGSRVWDIDGNEYVDYHNGYGVMVMGHAHRRSWRPFASGRSAPTSPSQPRTRCRLPSSSPSGLPYWRFGNSGTEATLDAVRIMRASTGRDLIVKVEEHLRAPRRPDGERVPAEQAGLRDRPNSVPQTPG